MDEQEKLSEAYSNLKEMYIDLQAQLTREKNINKIYRRFFNFANSEDKSIEQILSESHDDLITRYAKRGAQLRALQKKL